MEREKLRNRERGSKEEKNNGDRWDMYGVH